jgi:hypothetical protein|tara:strand:- start:338 stop:559 length:222 start_codon:yes stop_codon:yes gene_type:complete
VIQIQIRKKGKKMKYTLAELNKKYQGKDIFINATMVPSFNWTNRGIKEFTIQTSNVCRENFETLEAINRRHIR